MATRPSRRADTQRSPLRVVRGGRPKRSALVPAAAVLILGVFAVAAVQAYLGQEALRAATLERQVKEAEERYALLRAQVAELSSPSRLEQTAAERGMVPASEPVFLRAPGPMPRPDGATRDPYAAKRLLAGVP